MRKEKAVAFTKARLVLPKNSGLKDFGKISERLENKFGVEFEQVFFRGEDIPEIVEQLNSNGVFAIGLTGNDLFQEYLCRKSSRLKALETIEWTDEGFLFKKPSLCLLGKQEICTKEKPLVVAVNRKFELLSRNFLEKLARNGIEFEAKVLNGNVEAAVSEGLADYCVEIVCSGSSAKKAGLRVLDVFFQSDWVVVGPAQERQETLERLFGKVSERIAENAQGSYTAQIVREGKVLRKLNEECFELCQAALEGRESKIVWESADLLYFLTVLLAERKISLQQVWNELERRELENKLKKEMA